MVAKVLATRERGYDPDTDDGVDFISSCGSEWIDVSVIETLKGELPAELSFMHGALGTECDLDFKIRKGRTYLLFGFEDQVREIWHLSGCSPSRPRKEAVEIIAAIRSYLASAS